MGQRIVRVTGDLLRSILLLPDDVKIVAMNTAMAFDSDELILKIESPNFESIKAWHQLPTIVPQYGKTVKECGCSVTEFRGFWDPPPAPPSTYAQLAMALGFDAAEEFTAKTDRAVEDFKAGKIDRNTARAAFGLPPLKKDAGVDLGADKPAVAFREFF